MKQSTIYALLLQECDDTRKRTQKHAQPKRKPARERDVSRKHKKTRSLHVARKTE